LSTEPQERRRHFRFVRLRLARRSEMTSHRYGGFISARWLISNWKLGRLHVGIPGRIRIRTTTVRAPGLPQTSNLYDSQLGALDPRAGSVAAVDDQALEAGTERNPFLRDQWKSPLDMRDNSLI
jgi:hypothetical protein